jgi:hypothetical protein
MSQSKNRSLIQAVFAIAGLYALVLGTGCGGSAEDRAKLAQLEPMFDKAAAAANADCHKINAACLLGIPAGRRAALKVIPQAIETRVEGDVSVTSIRLSGIDAYEYDFTGACEYEAQGNSADDPAVRSCIEGAKRLFVHMAEEACAQSKQASRMETMSESETQTCELSRSKVVAPAPANAEPLPQSLIHRRDDGCVGMKC